MIIKVFFNTTFETETTGRDREDKPEYKVKDADWPLL